MNINKLVCNSFVQILGISAIIFLADNDLLRSFLDFESAKYFTFILVVFAAFIMRRVFQCTSRAECLRNGEDSSINKMNPVKSEPTQEPSMYLCAKSEACNKCQVLRAIYETNTKALQSYNVLIWATPVALLTLIPNEIKQLSEHKTFLIIAALFNFILLFVLDRHDRHRRLIRDCVRKTEREFKAMSCVYSPFIPDFEPDKLKATELMRSSLFSICTLFLAFAVVQGWSSKYRQGENLAPSFTNQISLLIDSSDSSVNATTAASRSIILKHTSSQEQNVPANTNTLPPQPTNSVKENSLPTNSSSKPAQLPNQP